MSQINRLNRFLAGVIAVTFFVTNTLSPAPLAHAQSVESPSFVSSFKIPESFGHVNEILPASENAPVLIHIQEAHANYDAQKNIQSILQHLHENYGVNLILMEGAGYKLTPELFHFFSNDAVLQKKANDKLLQAGELTGAEVFMMDAPAKAEAWGVEDAVAYGKDRESFREVFKGRALADDFLDGFYLQWQKQAGVGLNKELREFLDRYVSYEEGQSSLADWLETLKKDASSALELDLTEAVVQGLWPTLVRYFRLKKVSAEIDLAKSEVEKKKFFSETRLPVSVVDEVNHVFSVAKTGNLPVYETRFVFERLMDALPKDFSFDAYPNLRLHIQQNVLMSELQSERLQQEIRGIAKKIVEARAKTEEEQKHVALLREYQLLKKIFHLELSREEYQQVLKRGFDPEKLAASLKGSGLRNQGSEKNLSLPPDLSDLFVEALNFYKGAIEREDFMMQKALARMKESQQTKAVLITGGFHTEGLKEKILSEGNAYVGITPNIGEIAADSQKNYLTALLGQDSIKRSQIAPVVRSEIRFQQEVSPQNWRREMAAVGARVSEIVRQVSPEGVPAVHRNFVSAVLSSQGRSEVRPEAQVFSTEMPLEAAGRLLQKLGIEVKGAEIRGAQQQICPWNDALVLAKVQLVRGVHFSEISVLYDRSEVGQERRLYSEENHMIRYGWGPEFDPQTERLVFRTYADEARKVFTDRPIQDKKLEEIFGKTPATTAERDLSISRSEARGQFGFTNIAEVKAFLELNQERFDEREQFILLHRLKVAGGEFWTYAKIAKQSERSYKLLGAPAKRGVTGQAIGTAEEKIFAKLGYLLARPSKIQNPQNATLKDIVDEIRFWQNKSNLGVRLENLINNIEIPDLKTLRRMKGTDFAQYRNIGKEVIGALREALSDYGLGDLGVEEPVQTRARVRGREDEDPLKKAAQAVGVMQDSSGIFEKLLQLPGAVALVADEVLSALDRLSTSEQRFAILGLFGSYSGAEVLIRMLRFPERGAVLQSLKTKEDPKSLFYTLLYTGRHQEAAKTESAYDLALQAVKEHHLEAARVLEILIPEMEDAQKKQVFEVLLSQIQPLSGEVKAEAPYRTSEEESADRRALLAALEAIGTPEAMLQVLLHSDIQNLPLKARLFVQKEGGADSLAPFLPEFFVKGQSSEAKELTRFLAPRLSEKIQTDLALQLVSRKYAGDNNFPFYDAVESVGFLGSSPTARFFSLVLRPLKHFDYGPALRVKGVDVVEGLLALLRSKDGRMAHEAHFVFDALFLDPAHARNLFSGREMDLFQALKAFPEERLKYEAKSARSRAQEFRRIFPEVTTTLTSKRSETRESEKIDDYKTYAYALLEDPVFRPIALSLNSGIRRTYQFILRHHSPFRPEDFLDFAAIAQMTGLAACTVRWYEGFATAHVVGLNRYLDRKAEERDARNKGEAVAGRSEVRAGVQPQGNVRQGIATLLIVDDKESELMGAFLKRAFPGIQVLAAENPEEALRILKEQGASLDAAFLDFHLVSPAVYRGMNAVDQRENSSLAITDAMQTLGLQIPFVIQTDSSPETIEEIQLEVGDRAEAVVPKGSLYEAGIEALKRIDARLRVHRSEVRVNSKREKILEEELSLWNSNEYQSVMTFASKLHRLERTLQAMAKTPWNDEAVAKAFAGYVRKFMAPDRVGIPQSALVERSLWRLFSGDSASVVREAALKVIQSPEDLLDEGYRDAVIKVTEALANRVSYARILQVREALALSDGFMGSSVAAFLWGSASTVAGMFSAEQNEFLTLTPTTQQSDLEFLREIHQRSAIKHAKMLFEEKFKGLQKKQRGLIEPSGEAAEVVYAQVRDLVASRGGFEIVTGSNGSFKIVPEKMGELHPWSELHAKAAAAEVKDFWMTVPNPPAVLSRVSPDEAQKVLQTLLGEGNVARIQMLGYTPEPLVTIQNGQVLVRLNFIHWRGADGFYVRKDGLLGFTVGEDEVLPDTVPEVTAAQLLARSETRSSGSKPTAFENFLDQRIQTASTQAEGLKRRTSLYGDASEQAALLAEQIRGDEKLLRSLTVERLEEDRWPKRSGPEEDLGPRAGGRSETREGSLLNLSDRRDDPVERGIKASENFIGEKEDLVRAWRSFKKHHSERLSFPIVSADLPTIEKALLETVDQLQKSRGQRILKRSLIAILGAGIVSRTLVELPSVNSTLIGGIFAVSMAALIFFVLRLAEQPSAYERHLMALSGMIREIMEPKEENVALGQTGVIDAISRGDARSEMRGGEFLDRYSRKIEGRIQTAEVTSEERGELLRVWKNFWKGDFLFASGSDLPGLEKALLKAAERAENWERRVFTAGLITVLGGGIVFRLLAELPAAPVALLGVMCAVTLAGFSVLFAHSESFFLAEAQRLVALRGIAHEVIEPEKTNNASVQKELSGVSLRSEMRDPRLKTTLSGAVKRLALLAVLGMVAFFTWWFRETFVIERFIQINDTDRRSGKRLWVQFQGTSWNARRIQELVKLNIRMDDVLPGQKAQLIIDFAPVAFAALGGLSDKQTYALLKAWRLSGDRGEAFEIYRESQNPGSQVQTEVGVLFISWLALEGKETVGLSAKAEALLQSYWEPIEQINRELDEKEEKLGKSPTKGQDTKRSEMREDLFGEVLNLYTEKYARFAGEENRNQGVAESLEALGGYREAKAIFNDQDLTSDTERGIVAKMMAYGRGYAFQGWQGMTSDQKHAMLAGWKSVGIEIPEKLKRDTEIFNRWTLGILRAMGLWWPVAAILKSVFPELKATPLGAQILSFTVSGAISFGLFYLKDLSVARATAKKQAAKAAEAALQKASQTGPETTSRSEAREGQEVEPGTQAQPAQDAFPWVKRVLIADNDAGSVALRKLILSVSPRAAVEVVDTTYDKGDLWRALEKRSYSLVLASVEFDVIADQPKWFQAVSHGIDRDQYQTPVVLWSSRVNNPKIKAALERMQAEGVIAGTLEKPAVQLTGKSQGVVLPLNGTHEQALRTILTDWSRSEMRLGAAFEEITPSLERAAEILDYAAQLPMARIHFVIPMGNQYHPDVLVLGHVQFPKLAERLRKIKEIQTAKEAVNELAQLESRLSILAEGWFNHRDQNPKDMDPSLLIAHAHVAQALSDFSESTQEKADPVVPQRMLNPEEAAIASAGSPKIKPLDFSEDEWAVAKEFVDERAEKPKPVASPKAGGPGSMSKLAAMILRMVQDPDQKAAVQKAEAERHGAVASPKSARSEMRQEMILGEYPARAEGTVTLANRVAGILAQSEKPEFKGIDLERVRISKVEFKRIEDVPKELQADGAKRFNISHQGQAIPLSGLDARVKKFFGIVDASLFESVEWEVAAKEISQVAPKVLVAPAEGEHKKFALKKPAALAPQGVPAPAEHKKITFKKHAVGETKTTPKVLLPAHPVKTSEKVVVSKKVSSQRGLDRAVVVIWSAVAILALGLGIAWFLLGRPSKTETPAIPGTSLIEQPKIPAASPARSEVRDQEERYQGAVATLRRYGQEQVLAFWAELDTAQREQLLGQVERVDWEEIARLKETLVDHPQTKVLDLSTAEPVRLAEANDPEDREAGEELLSWGAQENKAAFGVVLMAGGSGARFREYFPYAKGLFKGLPLSEDTLFESMIKKYKAFANRYGHTKIFPFIIVTSDVTHDETMSYFEAHRWFGMKDRIKVVKQKVLPVLVQATGKALMEDKGKLTLQGGGHGDAFDYILQLSEVKDWLSGFGVRTVLYSNIDNPLYPLDVNWVGAHARFVKEVKEGKVSLPKGFAIMSEGLIRKKDRLKDKLSELLRVNGIRMPVHYSKASPELRGQTSHGTPSFRMIELPLEGTQWIAFSVADKKWDGIDEKGQSVKQIPVWKFERNSDDKMSDGANFPFENADTFASIKEPPGKEESPDTSRALQTKHWKTRLEAAGYQVGDGFLIQLPWAADFMTPEELRRKLEGIQFPNVLNDVWYGQMVKGYIVHEDWTWGVVRSEVREPNEIDKDVLSLKNAGALIERFFPSRQSVRGYNLNPRSVGHRVAEVDTVRGPEKRLVMFPTSVKAHGSTAMVTELLNNLGTKKDSKIPAFKKVQFEGINPSVRNPSMETEAWGGISDLWKRDKADLVTIIEPNFSDLPAMIRTAKKLVSKKTNSFIVVSLTRGDTNAFLEDGRFRSEISPEQIKKVLADFRIVRLPAQDPQWSPNGDEGVILFVYSPQGSQAIDALFAVPGTSRITIGEASERISARSELREVVELIVMTSLLLSFVGVGVLIKRSVVRPLFYHWQRIPEYILYRDATSKLDPSKEKDQQVLLAIRHILKGSTLLSYEFRDSHYNEQYDAWAHALDLAKDADEVKYLLEILVRRDLEGRYPYGPVYFTVRDLEYAPLIKKIRELLKDSGKRQPSGSILLDKKTHRWITDEALMKGIHFEPHAKAPTELIPAEDAKTPRILVADTDVGSRFLMGILLKKFPRAKVSVARVDSHSSSSEFWKKMKGAYDLVLVNLDVTGTAEEWDTWTEEVLSGASAGQVPTPVIFLSSQLERPLAQKMAQEGFVAGIIEKPKKITVDSKGAITYRLSPQQTQALNALLEKQGLNRSEMRAGEGASLDAIVAPEKLSELAEVWGKAGVSYSYLNDLIEGMQSTQRSPFEKLRRLTNEMYLVKNGLEAIVNSISGDNLDVVKKRLPAAIQVLTGISRRMQKQEFLRAAAASLADSEKSWASLLYLAVKLASFRDLFDKSEEKMFSELKEKALASAASFKATHVDRGANEARDVAYQRFWFDLDRLPIPAKEDDLMLFLESLAQDILNEVLSDPKPSEEGVAYDIFKYRTYSYYLQEGIKRKATFTFKSTTDSIVGLGYREADGPQYLPVFDRGGFGYFSSAEGQEMKTRATLIGGPLWEAMLGSSGMVQVFDALTGVGYKTYAISDLISNGLPAGIPQKQGFQVLKFVRLDGRQRIEIGRTGHPFVTALIGLAKEKPFRGEQSYAEYLTSECTKVLDNPQALEELLEQVTYLSSATARDEFGPALKAVMTFAAFLTPNLLEDMKSWDREHYKRLKAILENGNYRDLFQKGSIHFHKTDPSIGFAISRTLDGKVLTAAIHFSGNHYKQNNEKVWFRVLDPESAGIRNTPAALYVVRDRLRQLIFGERTGASFFQSYGLSGWHLGVDQDDRSQILEVVPFSEELKERVTAVFKEREWTLPLDVTDFSVKVVVRPGDAKPTEIAAALEAVLKDLKKDLPRLQGRINVLEQHDIENVENVVLDVFRSEVRVLASLISAPSLLAVSAAAVLGMWTGVLLWSIGKNRAIALKKLPEYFSKEQLEELIRLYRDDSHLEEDDAQELADRLRDLFAENYITESFGQGGRLKLWRIGGVPTLQAALKSFEAKAGRSEARVGEEDLPRIKEALTRVAASNSDAGIRKTARILLDTGLSSHGRKGFKEAERANRFLESLKRSEARAAKFSLSKKEIQRRETTKEALKKVPDVELMRRLSALPKSGIPVPTLERLASITAYYHESDRIPAEWRTLVIQTISAYATPAEAVSSKEKEALPVTLESLYYESVLISKYPKDIDVAMTFLGMQRTIHLSSQFLEQKKDKVLGLLQPLLQRAQAQGTNPQKEISFWKFFGHTPRPSLKREEEAALAWGQQLGLWKVQNGLDRILPKQSAPAVLKEKEIPLEGNPLIGKFLASGVRMITSLGAPGSGKGTLLEWFVAELNKELSKGGVANEYKILTVSDHLKPVLQAQFPEEYEKMKSGVLVSDDIIIQVINSVLAREEYAQAYGIFFDGFPRTSAQWDRVAELQWKGKPVVPEMHIIVDAPDEVLFERMAGRVKEDWAKGKVRPDAVNAVIVQDSGVTIDREAFQEVYDNRMMGYKTDTAPMIERIRTTQADKTVAVASAEEKTDTKKRFLTSLEAFLAKRSEVRKPAPISPTSAKLPSERDLALQRLKILREQAKLQGPAPEVESAQPQTPERSRAHVLAERQIIFRNPNGLHKRPIGVLSGLNRAAQEELKIGGGIRRADNRQYAQFEDTLQSFRLAVEDGTGLIVIAESFAETAYPGEEAALQGVLDIFEKALQDPRFQESPSDGSVNYFDEVSDLKKRFDVPARSEMRGLVALMAIGTPVMTPRDYFKRNLELRGGSEVAVRNFSEKIMGGIYPLLANSLNVIEKLIPAATRLAAAQKIHAEAARRTLGITKVQDSDVFILDAALAIDKGAAAVMGKILNGVPIAVLVREGAQGDQDIAFIREHIQPLLLAQKQAPVLIARNLEEAKAELSKKVRTQKTAPSYKALVMATGLMAAELTKQLGEGNVVRVTDQMYTRFLERAGQVITALAQDIQAQFALGKSA